MIIKICLPPFKLTIWKLLFIVAEFVSTDALPLKAVNRPKRSAGLPPCPRGFFLGNEIYRQVQIFCCVERSQDANKFSGVNLSLKPAIEFFYNSFTTYGVTRIREEKNYGNR